MEEAKKIIKHYTLYRNKCQVNTEQRSEQWEKPFYIGVDKGLSEEMMFELRSE